MPHHVVHRPPVRHDAPPSQPLPFESQINEESNRGLKLKNGNFNFEWKSSKP
jgi:hypothetical protein